MKQEVIPFVKLNVDATEIAEAVNIANELIEQIDLIQSKLEKLMTAGSNLDIKITVDGKPADSTPLSFSEPVQ